MLPGTSFWKIIVHFFAFCTAPHLSVPHRLPSKWLEEIFSRILFVFFSKPLWTCSYPTFRAWIIFLFQISLMPDIQASMTVLKRNQWCLHTVFLFPFPYFFWQIISMSEHLSLLFYRPSSCCMTRQLLLDFSIFLWLLIRVTRVSLLSFVFWMLLSISFTTSCSLLSLRPHESTDVSLHLCVNTKKVHSLSMVQFFHGWWYFKPLNIFSSED